MLTSEEKEEIIQEATERMLLAIPEVIGNLMTNHAMLHKINSQFYKDHPEFKDHKDAVQSVVEFIEGKNPLMQYEDILKTAIPEIKKRIQTTQNLNLNKVDSSLPRNFPDVDLSSNGVL